MVVKVIPQMTPHPPREATQPLVTVPNMNAPAQALPVVDAQKLLAGRREVWIEHAGVRYCLCLTRRNRLMLRK